MTPTPIPEWFRAWAKRYADGNSIDAHPKIWEHLNAELYEAAINTYRLLSSQGLRWVKAEKELPKRDGYYNARYAFNRCVLDMRRGKIHEIRGLAHIMSYPDVEIEYLEWLDESPAPIQ